MGSIQVFWEKANQLRGCRKELTGEKVLEGRGERPARKTQRQLASSKLPDSRPANAVGVLAYPPNWGACISRL